MKKINHICIFLEGLVSPKDAVLDLGTGDGRYARFIREYIGAKVTTIDAWPSVCPDLVWDLEQTPLPYEERTYDIVLMIDVIEHLDKEAGQRLLIEAKRLAKRAVFVFTPLTFQENHVFNKPNVWYTNNPHIAHRSLWTKEDFEGWIEVKLPAFDEDAFGVLWRRD